VVGSKYLRMNPGTMFSGSSGPVGTLARTGSRTTAMKEDDPEKLSEASGIGDQDGLQEQYSGRVFPSGLKIEG
jgi:hypothetical protein